MHPRGISLFRAPGISRWIVTTLAVAAVILSAMTATVAATAADGADVPTTSEQPQDAATPEETEQPIDSPEETEPPAEPEEPDAPADSSDEEEPSGEVLEPVTPADPVDPQAILAGFSAGNIISDAVFTDKGTMTEAQIQAFFNSKVKTCRGGSDSYGPIVCLKDYRTDSVNRPADAYCKGYTGAKGETAARIIHRVAQSCNINPRVLIVMLQKEQSLVTHTWPSAWRYDKALGQGCPDDASCNPAYVGFFYQIYGAARQMQIYMEGRYFTWYAPGKTWNIRYDVEVSCGSSPVYVSNKATSAMYYYTPYQPNAASLKAGYGSGDSCSSYGNRNFYNYFTDWFGSTHTADVCAVPGTVTSASRQYVTTTGLNARMAPSTSCDKSVFTLETGTVVQTIRMTPDGEWFEVHTQKGSRWVSRTALAPATETDIAKACVAPEGAKSITARYLVETSRLSWLSPATLCGLDGLRTEVGTVVEATRISASGVWIEIRVAGGTRWLPRSAVAACIEPSGTASENRYVARVTSAAYSSPLVSSACGPNAKRWGEGTAPRTVQSGTVLQATRVSGEWLEVRTSVGSRWVSLKTVAKCNEPTGVRSSKRYLATTKSSAYSSPITSSACGPSAKYWGTGTGPRTVQKGTVLQSTRTSGDWVEIQTAVGLRWVRLSTVATCNEPAATATTRKYTASVRTTGYSSPLETSACGPSARYWGTGTAPIAIAAGASLQAVRVTRAGDWIEVRTAVGPRWIRRTDARAQ